MNDGRYSTFIDMKKMKEDGLICDEKALIHQRQIDEICRIIKERMEYREYNPSQKIKSENNVISIFARRGAGKTTFVKSLKKLIREHVNQDEFHGIDCSKLVVIDVIEPNQIQKKENFMIRFLASIHGKFLYLMEDYKENDKRRFDEATTALYEALPIIDGVGKLGMYTDWTDVDYVADNFVNLAMKAKDLERRFHEYINVALSILNKKSLLFILDDCDVNIEKTFEILETIRLYFTSPQIIVMMTGDANLYGMTIRQNYWKFFEKDFLEKECENSASADRKRAAYRKMVNRLETQYLQKMIKPEYRILLDNVYEKYRYNRIITNQESDESKAEPYSVTIRFSNGKTQDLRVIYEDIFSYLDVISKDETDKAIFVNHVLRQPFRNQYRLLSVYDDFLRDNSQLSDEEKKIALTDKLLKVFEVYINQYAADNKHLMAKTSMYAGWIMKFLIDNKIVATGSHMMPNMEDDSLNNAILALCTSCTRQIHTNPSIAFDFLVRVSFIRQVLLSLGEDGTKLNDFAHIYYDSGTNKLLGNVLAYANAEMNMIPSIRPESNFQNTMAGVFAFDQPIAHQDGIKGLLINLIQLRTISSDMSDTKLCSIFRLFAAIAEILRVAENINADEDKNGKIRKAVIKAKLQHLAQIHTYIEPNDLKPGRRMREENSEYLDLILDDKTKEVDDFVEILWKWIGDFRKIEKLTPYNLNRIFTRMYYTLNDITPKGNVEAAERGEYICNYILSFWNACIVEDCIVNNEIFGIELGHEGNMTEIFLNNYAYYCHVFNEKERCKHFSYWIINCPVLMSYVDSDILHFLGQKETNRESVKGYVLKSVITKLRMQDNSLENMLELTEHAYKDIQTKLDKFESVHHIELEISIIKNEINKKDNSYKQNTFLLETLKQKQADLKNLLEYLPNEEELSLQADLKRLRGLKIERTRHKKFVVDKLEELVSKMSSLKIPNTTQLVESAKSRNKNIEEIQSVYQFLS